MVTFKPVAVSRGGYAFCRWFVAGLIWFSLFMRWPFGLFLVLLILASSALLKIKRAPLVNLYSHTIDYLWPSGNVILDEKAMRFAHTLGTFLAFLALILVYFVPIIGWMFTVFFALAKTAGAMGYCAAQKLYGCVTSGENKTCCKIISRVS